MFRFIRGRKSDLSDEELLQRWQERRGDHWLALLFDRYLELTYGLCLRYLKEENRAEDATMMIYQELHRKLSNQEVRHFRNWLYSFVRNYCLMEIRRDQRSSVDWNDPALMHFSETVHQEEEEELDQLELEAALQDCIRDLKEEQQRCIQLFYLENQTYKEIAKRTQLELGKVRSHLQNGRRNLRRCIEAKARTS